MRKKYPYKRLKLPSGKLIDQHRLIMQGILCRELEPDEVVHHKDGNPMNNQPCNLELMTRAEHSRHHAMEDNVHERFSKSRACAPSNGANFTYVEAALIKELYDRTSESMSSIARHLGVHYSIIQRICRGNAY